jgi:hypothetical protein
VLPQFVIIRVSGPRRFIPGDPRSARPLSIRSGLHCLDMSALTLVIAGARLSAVNSLVRPAPAHLLFREFGVSGVNQLLPSVRALRALPISFVQIRGARFGVRWLDTAFPRMIRSRQTSIPAPLHLVARALASAHRSAYTHPERNGSAHVNTIPCHKIYDTHHRFYDTRFRK